MSTTTTTRQDIGLLALRVGLGGTLFAHGAQKLFGWFGGHGIAGTTGAMTAMGFHPAKTSAVLAGLGEAAGGALLAAGLATPVAGAAATSTMIAAGSVNKDGGFFATQGGYEYTAVLGLAGAALSVAGPGRFSLDELLGDRLNRPWMSTTALTALGGAAIALVVRRNQAIKAAAVPTAVDQLAASELGENAGDLGENTGGLGKHADV
jgi:putative oxidoreductase